MSLVLWSYHTFKSMANETLNHFYFSNRQRWLWDALPLYELVLRKIVKNTYFERYRDGLNILADVMGEVGRCAVIWQKREDSYTRCQGIVGGRSTEGVHSGNTLSTTEIHLAASYVSENSYNPPVIFLGCFLKDSSIAHICVFVCMYVCVLLFMETRRRHWIPWNWNCKSLWAAL